MSEQLSTTPGDATTASVRELCEPPLSPESQSVTIQDCHIQIIYTGGTIGMLPNNHGSFEPAKGYLTNQMKSMKQLKDPKMPTYDIIEYDPLLDSSDMGATDWIRIATDIERFYHEVDGFVIIMGTDTMTYCASGISFMLQNLGKPVIFTGGAIPLCEVFNDSRRNLVVSMLLACSTNICEVCIFFADALYRANRSVKVSSESLHAFKSPDFPPLATLSVQGYMTPLIRTDLLLDPPKGRLIVHKNLDTRMLVVKLAPGLDDESLMAIVKDPEVQMKALVLETYGVGNALLRKRGLLEVVQIAIARNVVVFIISEVLHGKLNLKSYELGRKMLEMGVISGEDMTSSALVAKLAYLFGRGLNGDQVRAAMQLNLRGEISESAYFSKFDPLQSQSSKL